MGIKMIEFLTYFCFFAFGLFLGREKTQPPSVDTTKLDEQIKYYKNLCKWHVQNTDKLKQHNQMLEDECKAMRDQLNGK